MQDQLRFPSIYRQNNDTSPIKINHLKPYYDESELSDSIDEMEDRDKQKWVGVMEQQSKLIHGMQKLLQSQNTQNIQIERNSINNRLEQLELRNSQDFSKNFITNKRNDIKFDLDDSALDLAAILSSDQDCNYFYNSLIILKSFEKICKKRNSKSNRI